MSRAPRDDLDRLAAWLMDLCAIDTTTGNEDRGLPALTGILDELGADVHLQEVAPGRSNVLATWGAPRVLFSTHTDTVPPHLAPQRAEDAVRGRGACDAKGQIVAQLAAVGRLLEAGFEDVAWLGVVGEETTSDGARAALELAPRLGKCVAVINGEPTGNALASGQRGAQHVRLSCRGKAAHSGLPQLGRNAIWELVDWLAALRGLPPTSSEELGDEVWNLASMRGGGAANVIPDRAEAEIFARTVPGSKLVEAVRERAPKRASVQILLDEPAVLFDPLPGFRTAAVPFGSDAVTLRQLARDGTIVLAGPGSIEVAHTTDEHLRLDEAIAGVELNTRLARYFLENDPRPQAPRRED